MLSTSNLHEKGFHSFANKAKSILLETTAWAHTNIHKNLDLLSIYMQILHFCVPLLSHQLCLKPQSKEFLFAVPEATVCFVSR